MAAEALEACITTSPSRLAQDIAIRELVTKLEVLNVRFHTLNKHRLNRNSYLSTPGLDLTEAEY